MRIVHRIGCIAAILCTAGAWAQTEEPDASLPDASVGQGGAGQDTPDEETDVSGIFCRQSSDCPKGFACNITNGKCRWNGYTKAAGCGCGLAEGAPLALAGLATMAGRGRRRRR